MQGKRVFIDSNILIYSVSDDGDKSKIAQALLAKHHIVISVQVLNEFCNVVLKKKILTFNDTLKSVKFFSEKFDVLSIDKALVTETLSLKNRLNYSYWDSLIIATALASGVSRLYSEDMHHNQNIDGQLTIINPFLA